MSEEPEARSDIELELEKAITAAFESIERGDSPEDRKALWERAAWLALVKRFGWT